MFVDGWWIDAMTTIYKEVNSANQVKGVGVYVVFFGGVTKA